MFRRSDRDPFRLERLKWVCLVRDDRRKITKQNTEYNVVDFAKTRMQHERVAANASDFSCVLKVLPVLVGHVLEDVLTSHGQNSG